MSAIIQDLNLDVVSRSKIEIIHVKQNDANSRNVRTHINVDGQVRTISGSGYTALINFRRPDGKTDSFSATINNDNTVTANIATWAMEVVGDVSASISVMEGSTLKYSTESFIIKVERSDNPDGSIAEQDSTEILLELIAYVNDAVDRVNNIIDTTEANKEAAEAAAAAAAQSAASVDVHTDGTYPNMYVGTAREVMGDKTGSDAETYRFRKSKATSKRETPTLVGATVAFNQLSNCTDRSAVTTNGLTYSFSNGVMTLNGTAEADTDIQFNAVYAVRIVKDHMYGLFYTGGGSGTTYRLVDGTTGTTYDDAAIIKKGSTYDTNIRLRVYEGASFSYAKFTAFVCDLTLALGSDIADKAYTMEQATAGSGIAWLKSYGFFTKPYYAYDAGSLKSVKVSAHKDIGFNQWDEDYSFTGIDVNTGAVGSWSDRITSKNYIPVIDSQIYYFKGIGTAVFIHCYDAEKNWLGTIDNGYGYIGNNGGTFTLRPNTAYIKFAAANNTYGTTYNHDICINISKPTGTPKNGDYVAYDAHTYALDSTKEWRGIFYLDGNEIKADGDIYPSNGQGTRKYGIVDFGTLNWVLNNHVTLGDYFYTTGIADIKYDGAFETTVYSLLSSRYIPVQRDTSHFVNGTMCADGGGGVVLQIQIKDSAYSDAATFKTAMSGQYLVYEKATPTAETAAEFSAVQICDPDGTEEWVDGRDVQVPVYTLTDYYDVWDDKRFKATEDELVQILYDTLPTDTITNTPIATFPDGADNVPVKSATFTITPVQDLHGYDSPWPAGGGKNKCDQDTVYALYKQSDGSFLGKGTDIPFEKVYIPASFVGVECTFSAMLRIPSGSSITNLRAYASVNGTVTSGNTINVPDYTLSSVTFTPTSTSDYVGLSYGSNGVYNMQFKDAQLELGSTATSFAPYSNICPISGFTGAEITAKGVSLWDEEWEVGAYNSATGAKIPISTVSNRIRTKGFIPICPSESYYLKANANLQVYEYAENKSFLRQIVFGSKDIVFTADSDAYYLTFNTGQNTGETYNHDISINYPSTDTAYHASVGATKDITWQDEAGTVYGGTLQYLGGDAWRLTSDRAIVDFSDIDWTYAQIASRDVFRGDSLQPMPLNKTNAYCSIFKVVGGTELLDVASDNVIATSTTSISSTNTRCYVRCSAYTDATTFKTAMAGQQLVYELATPVVYDLTGEELATVLGTNNIFSNTGDVTELVYRADTALFVQKKLGA